MPLILKTERLYLRNLCPADAQAMFAYRNDPRCYKFQRWKDTSMEAIRAFIADFQEDTFLSRKPEQHYAICTHDGQIVGDMAYFYTEKDNCITLGITVSPQFQRKGYAFEMLSAVTAAARERHPQMELVALIDKENEPSLSLFEKLGFYRECYAESIGSYVMVRK